MRVIAGRFGGRRLKSPTHTGLRPTTDRVREALFNIIGGRAVGARVLDLFAGTGSLGIEALSRGAIGAVFLERDRRAVLLLRDNLAALRLNPEESKIIAAPVAEGLRRLAGNARFDLIFADPPYEAEVIDATLALLAEGHLIAPGGLVVVEHRAVVPVAAPRALAQSDQRVYGDTALTFFSAREEQGVDCE